jgi:hypothetical protein
MFGIAESNLVPVPIIIFLIDLSSVNKAQGTALLFPLYFG